MAVVIDQAAKFFFSQRIVRPYTNYIFPKKNTMSDDKTVTKEKKYSLPTGLKYIFLKSFYLDQRKKVKKKFLRFLWSIKLKLWRRDTGIKSRAKAVL